MPAGSVSLLSTPGAIAVNKASSLTSPVSSLAFGETLVILIVAVSTMLTALLLSRERKRTMKLLGPSRPIEEKVGI